MPLGFLLEEDFEGGRDESCHYLNVLCMYVSRRCAAGNRSAYWAADSATRSYYPRLISLIGANSLMFPMWISSARTRKCRPGPLMAVQQSIRGFRLLSGRGLAAFSEAKARTFESCLCLI